MINVNVCAYGVDISLIIHLGNVTASISGKSGHAFVVYGGFDLIMPNRIR